MAFLAATVGGCSDEPVSAGAGSGTVVIAPQFSFNGPAANLPIEVVQLTPTLLEGGPLGQPHRQDVSPTATHWSVRAPIDLGGRDSATILVYVEMLSLASGSEIIEWSGVVGPVLVRADAANAIQSPVEMFRGPLENQLVDSLYISGPSQLLAGQIHTLYAYVRTRGSSHTVLWTSSDESVLTVDPVGDSVDVRATGGGSALIIAAAGTRADTLEIFVDTTTVGPVAQVVAYPDSANVILGGTRTWQAYALDAQGYTVSATFAWASLDPAVATVTSAGVVAAQALGRARIVVSAAGFADTAIARVEPLPEGVDLVWQGGTAGAEQDWFTADNWSPSQVPGASSVIYLASTPYGITLTGNASVGSILSDSLGAWVDLGVSTLTVHGDVLLGYNGIYGEPGSRLVVDAPSAAIAGSLPPTTLLGMITSANNVFIDGDLLIDGSSRPAYLYIPVNWIVAVYGSARLTNAHLVMREDSAFNVSYFYTEGDLTIDGGDSSNSLTGGIISVYGDFTVTASTCTAFAPSGTEVDLYSANARISVGCSARSGNRFADLYVYSSTSGERLLYLDTDISITREFYLGGGYGTRVVGNGVTIDAAAGAAYAVTLDHVFLEVDIGLADRTFWMDSVTFTGMTGQTRPQLRYLHPGEPFGYSYHSVLFDSSSSGPYLEAIDAVPGGDTLMLYMAHNPGDGPERTVLAGGAQVHWADVPYHLVYWSGSGQFGPSNQPLPDSLRAGVVDFAFYPVGGVSVDWTVTAGGGSVSPATSATDASGIAATQFTVGDTTSPTQSAIATSAVLPADTVYYSGSLSGSPSGSTDAATVGALPTAPPAQTQQDTVRARAVEPIRREVTPRPERPAARPERTSEGDLP